MKFPAGSTLPDQGVTVRQFEGATMVPEELVDVQDPLLVVVNVPAQEPAKGLCAKTCMGMESAASTKSDERFPAMASSHS